MKPMSAQA